MLTKALLIGMLVSGSAVDDISTEERPLLGIVPMIKAKSWIDEEIPLAEPVFKVQQLIDMPPYIANIGSDYGPTQEQLLRNIDYYSSYILHPGLKVWLTENECNYQHETNCAHLDMDKFQVKKEELITKVAEVSLKFLGDISGNKLKWRSPSMNLFFYGDGRLTVQVRKPIMSAIEMELFENAKENYEEYMKRTYETKNN